MDFILQFLLGDFCGFCYHELTLLFSFDNLTLVQNYMGMLYADPMLLHTVALVYLISIGTCVLHVPLV